LPRNVNARANASSPRRQASETLGTFRMSSTVLATSKIEALGRTSGHCPRPVYQS
jgi:hypothetical protein